MFTEQDTEDALEYFRETALECPGCGLPRDETMAKENQFAYDAEPIRCHACASRDRRAQKFVRANGEQEGLMFTIIKETDG